VEYKSLMKMTSVNVIKLFIYLITNKSRAPGSAWKKRGRDKHFSLFGHIISEIWQFVIIIKLSYLFRHWQHDKIQAICLALKTWQEKTL
jgi:hypothetical protein